MATEGRRAATFSHWLVRFDCGDPDHGTACSVTTTVRAPRDGSELRDKAYAWLDAQGLRGAIASVREVL